MWRGFRRPLHEMGMSFLFRVGALSVLAIPALERLF